VTGKGGAGEVALEVRVPIWGIGSGGAHCGRLATVKQVSGGEPATVGQRRGGGRRLRVHGVAVSSSRGRYGGGVRQWPEEAGAGEVLTTEVWRLDLRTVYAEVWRLDLRTEACSGSVGGERDISRALVAWQLAVAALGAA
jgi:hypothetical protein